MYVNCYTYVTTVPIINLYDTKNKNQVGETLIICDGEYFYRKKKKNPHRNIFLHICILQLKFGKKANLLDP